MPQDRKKITFSRKRVKRRYILFECLPTSAVARNEFETSVTQDILEQNLASYFHQGFGTMGQCLLFAQHHVKPKDKDARFIVYFNAKTGMAVARVEHHLSEMFRTSMPTLFSGIYLNDTRRIACTIKIIDMSGTLRSIQERMIVRHQKEMHQMFASMTVEQQEAVLKPIVNMQQK